MSKYKEKRTELQELQQELSTFERTLSLITTNERTKIQSLQILDIKQASLRRELIDQHAKRQRAEKNWKKKEAEFINKEARSTDNSPDVDCDEVADLKLREVKDRCNLTFTEICKIAEQYKEISSFVEDFCEQVTIIN